jgi:hypothetical protein
LTTFRENFLKITVSLLYQINAIYYEMPIRFVASGFVSYFKD